MKKVINGKSYNTETSKKLADISYGQYGNFEYWEEVLYRTSRGALFLYGEGGATTKYSRSTGDNSWSSGWDIIPLSDDAAKKWVEEYCNGEEYERIFGETEEAGGDDLVNRERVNFVLSKAIMARLRNAVPKGDRSRVVDEAISAWLDNH